MILSSFFGQVNSDDFEILLQYLEGLKGKSREVTVKQAEKIIEEDDENGEYLKQYLIFTRSMYTHTNLEFRLYTYVRHTFYITVELKTKNIMKEIQHKKFSAYTGNTKLIHSSSASLASKSIFLWNLGKNT